MKLTQKVANRLTDKREHKMNIDENVKYTSMRLKTGRAIVQKFS